MSGYRYFQEQGTPDPLVWRTAPGLQFELLVSPRTGKWMESFFDGVEDLLETNWTKSSDDPTFVVEISGPYQGLT